MKQCEHISLRSCEIFLRVLVLASCEGTLIAVYIIIGQCRNSYEETLQFSIKMQFFAPRKHAKEIISHKRDKLTSLSVVSLYSLQCETSYNVLRCESTCIVSLVNRYRAFRL